MPRIERVHQPHRAQPATLSWCLTAILKETRSRVTS
jgi:hypothetical protein